MLKRTTLALSVAALLAVGGCGVESSETDTDTGGTITETNVRLKDGTSVRCLTFNTSYGGGLSCDWQPQDLTPGTDY